MQLNRPMLWHEFKALPVSLQQEYISHLQETFDVGYINIAKMMGCAAETLKTHLLVAGIQFQIKKGTTSRAARFAWREFVHQPDAEPEEVVSEEPESVHEEKPVKAPENWPILPDSLTLDITGDPVLLAEYIKALPLTGKYRMRVCLERAVEEVKP